MLATYCRTSQNHRPSGEICPWPCTGGGCDIARASCSDSGSASSKRLRLGGICFLADRRLRERVRELRQHVELHMPAKPEPVLARRSLWEAEASEDGLQEGE